MFSIGQPEPGQIDLGEKGNVCFERKSTGTSKKKILINDDFKKVIMIFNHIIMTFRELLIKVQMIEQFGKSYNLCFCLIFSFKSILNQLNTAFLLKDKVTFWILVWADFFLKKYSKKFGF